MIMTCNGELCPNKSVEMRSIGGDRITMVTYEDQLKKLCKENNLNFLNVLTQIQDKLMGDMLVRGNNTPLFKKKVSSVLGQWKNSPEYDVLFSLPDEELSFDYSDLIKCNSSVLDLGHQMKGLEELISSNSERLYPRVLELQKDCKEIDDSIKVCMGELDRVAQYYEPKYSRILLDLSTKPKSFYTQHEGDEQLSKMVYHKNMREIPENIPEIFSNAVFVPNMITKETDYIREMLQSLKGNVRDKHLVLADLQGNIPERVQNVDPITRLFRYFVDSSDEEDYSQDSDDDNSSVKPLTKEQVSDIDALIEDVQNKKDDSVLKIEDKGKAGKMKKVLENANNEEATEETAGETPEETAEGATEGETEGETEGAIEESSDEEIEEKQLIDLAKQNGGGNYELSFF